MVVEMEFPPAVQPHAERPETKEAGHRVIDPAIPGNMQVRAIVAKHGQRVLARADNQYRQRVAGKMIEVVRQGNRRRDGEPVYGD